MTRHAFTLGFLALGMAFLNASVAQADRVVLLPPTGTAPEERLDDIEEALATAIISAGHEAVTEQGADGERPAPPATANEMVAVAEMQNARWVVVPQVTDLEGRYELFVRVGYSDLSRVEELRVMVANEGQAERLADVMGAMLRPEGLGDDAVRLSEGDTSEDVPSGSGADEEARRAEEERARREEEARSREEFEARERERAEEAAAREREAWENRERYGSRAGRHWLLAAGGDIRPIVAVDSERDGGILNGLSLHVGRSFENLPGLELRGSFDLVTGATSGFTVAGGAAYFTSPFTDLPLFIGAEAQIGVFQGLTGNRVPSFVVRISPAIVWRATENFYLEGHAPEFQLFTANGGVATLGLGIRVGTRF